MPELSVCPFFVDDPSVNIGKWSGVFKKEQPICLELGCGKGGFAAQAALNEPDKNFLADCREMSTFAPLMITSSVALKNPLDASASGRVFLCFVVGLLLGNGNDYHNTLEINGVLRCR